jgi:hypothetical protein
MATPFLKWAIATKRCRKLRVPTAKRSNAPVLDQTERLEILKRLLDPDTGRLERLERRVAGMLVVLVAQPISRIVSLRVDQLAIDGDDVGICFGQGVTPIPMPFASMVRELASKRPHLNGAANPTSPWLLPGTAAGRHICPSTLHMPTARMGIDSVAARTAALRQLVLDCPPSVVATLLGYRPATIDRHAVQAGSRWASYAAMRAVGASQPC